MLNHIYTVVWNHVRNCYLVVSEIAKRHGKKSSTHKRVAAFLAVLSLTCVMGMSDAQAADNATTVHTTLVDGQNTTVEMTTTADGHKEYKVNVDLSSYAKSSEVAIVYANADKTSLYSTNSKAVGGNAIALGQGASAAADTIVIGKNASSSDSTVTKGQSVVLGNGAKASSKSTVVGSNDNGGGEGNITVRTNAVNQDSYSPVIGTDSSIDYLYHGDNTEGSAIFGAKNQIKFTKDANRFYAGNSDYVFGASNTITDSRGVIIQGAKNKVTNAYNYKNPVKEGAGVAVIGSRNSISNQTFATILGLDNVVMGDQSPTSPATSPATSMFVAGNRNTVQSISNAIVMGDDNVLKNRSNVISLGNKNQIEADNAVAVGYGAAVKAEGGVAIGTGSVADRAVSRTGAFAPADIPENNKSIWMATQGAVSVGDAAGNITRQITGVAAGSEDTDAVNVAQLKQVNSKAENAQAEAAKGWNVSTNSGIATKVAPGDTVDFAGDDNISVSNNGKNVKVELKKELAGLTSVTTKNAYVTNVAYVKSQIADAALSAGDGISISDKKINVKLKDGEENLVVNADGLALNKDLKGITSITGAGNGSITFAGGNVTVNNVTFNSDGRIQNVAAGTADTDAVNVGQLKTAVEAGNTDTHIKAGEYSVGAGNKVAMDVVDKTGKKIDTVTITDVAKASDVGDVSQIHTDLTNKDGSKTTVVDAVNNLNNKVGDLNYSQVAKGEIADGDSTTTAIGKLDHKLTDVSAVAGQHSSVSTTDTNIQIQEGTNAAGGKDYALSLNKDQKLDSVTTGETKMDTNGIQVGDKVSLTKEGLTAGDTKITNDGLSIGDKTYVTKDGLNANNQTITNVKDGKIEEGSKDAVNGGQLYATNQLVKENASNISLLGNSINKLDNRVDKVGAGAAALAALHPLDFDPEDKWDFAAGYGNYSGASAVALGAYYRPNEDTMFSVGGSFGNGENMVNAGVSLKLGQSSHAPTSKAAMEKKISSLSQEVEELKAAIADLRAAQTKAKDATEKDAQKK